MLPMPELARTIVEAYASRAAIGTVVLAIDGPDCAGKSTFAEAIRESAAQAGISAWIIHGDDYLHDVSDRFSKGEFAVDGFICDYFDWGRLRSRASRVVSRLNAGLVIVEGMFLLSPRVEVPFDITIRLEIGEHEVMKRALQRDVGRIGSRDWVLKHYTLQCLPAQRIYKHLVDPVANSDWLISFGGEPGHGKIIRKPSFK